MTVNKEYQRLADKLRETTHKKKEDGDYVIGNRWTRDSLDEIARGIEMLGSRPTLHPRTEQFMKLTQSITKNYIDSGNIGRVGLEHALSKFGAVAGMVFLDERLSKLSRLKDADPVCVRGVLLDIVEQALITALWLDDNFNTTDK